jgi:hypothetical protein
VTQTTSSWDCRHHQVHLPTQREGQAAFVSYEEEDTSVFTEFTDLTPGQKQKPQSTSPMRGRDRPERDDIADFSKGSPLSRKAHGVSSLHRSHQSLHRLQPRMAITGNCRSLQKYATTLMLASSRPRVPLNLHKYATRRGPAEVSPRQAPGERPLFGSLDEPKKGIKLLASLTSIAFMRALRALFAFLPVFVVHLDIAHNMHIDDVSNIRDLL